MTVTKASRSEAGASAAAAPRAAAPKAASFKPSRPPPWQAPPSSSTDDLAKLGPADEYTFVDFSEEVRPACAALRAPARRAAAR